MVYRERWGFPWAMSVSGRVLISTFNRLYCILRMTISRFMECFRTAPWLSVWIMMSLALQTTSIQTCFFYIMRKRMYIYIYIYLWTNKLLYFCFILLSGLCLLSIYRAVLMFVCTVTYFGNMGNLKWSLLAVQIGRPICLSELRTTFGTWRSRTSCSDGINPTTLHSYYFTWMSHKVSKWFVNGL